MSHSFIDMLMNQIISYKENVLNVCIHSEQHTFIREFLEILSENDKIKFIDIDGISDVDKKSFSRENKKIRNSDILMRDPNKTIVFVDFKGGFNVFGLDNDFTMSYTNKIEKNRYYRDKCIAVFLYRYNNEPLRSGYWKYHSNITEDLQYLTLSRWGQIVQQIPAPVPLTNIRSRESREDHLNGLKNFFITFMTLLLEDEVESNPELAQRIIQVCNSQDSISQLVVAFTHMSLSHLNYDIYEYMGDRISNCSLAVAMCSKYPNMDKTAASTYANYYNSAKGQEIFSEDLKLFDRMIKPAFLGPREDNAEKFQIKLKAKSDIYEAFIGCISRIMDKNFYSGSQFGICFKMVSYIVDTLSFDRNLLRRDYKTQVLQLLEMYNNNLKGTIKLLLETSKNGEPGKKVAFFRTERVLSDFLFEQQEGLNLAIDSISIMYDAYKISKDQIEEEMWRTCFEHLLSAGLSYEKVRKSVNSDLVAISRTERTLYRQFCEKLLEEYEGYPIEELLPRIVFEVDQDQGYISMSLVPYNFNNNGSYYNTFSAPIIKGQREEDIYEIYDIILENAKLSCVMMPREVSKDYNFANPKLYGIFLAIKEYVENGTMVEK